MERCSSSSQLVEQILQLLQLQKNFLFHPYLGCFSYRYLIFLGPLDVFFHLCSAQPVQLALFTVEEVGRAKKILSGVSAAAALYPQSLVAMAVVGLVKGASDTAWIRSSYLTM